MAGASSPETTLHNVSTRHGDGWQGWQARAPFDAIIVTAAPPEIPTALLAQLDDDGVLVLPVGEEHQFLKRIRRRGNEFIIDTVEAVRFVPVKGSWPETRIIPVFCLTLGVGWTHFSVSGRAPPGKQDIGS